MTETMTQPRPSIPAGRYAERLERARAVAAERGLGALLLGIGPDLRYLTGYVATPMERLTLLVLPVTGPARLVVPRLEAHPARGCPAAAGGLVEVVPWEETESAYEIVGGFVADTANSGLLGISDTLWAMHVLALQEILSESTFQRASETLRSLRMIKDPAEVELLRTAARAADRAIAAIAAGSLVARTEADVARSVRARLEEEGHDHAAFAIVASGPNSASPHHTPGDRVIQAGEPVILDIGGTVEGYSSDITRTIWIAGADGEAAPEPDFRALYDVLQRAQADATAAVKPGLPCEGVDAVARDVIDRAGYGAQFIHRTGHGIGLETHEDPYLVAGNGEPLAAGMAFSVEPGIYFEGRFGARIEDIVVCGPDGPDPLNQAPRDLLVVPG